MDKEQQSAEEQQIFELPCPKTSIAKKIILPLITISIIVGVIIFLIWGISMITASFRLKVAEIEYLPAHQEEIVLNVMVDGKQSEVKYLRSYPQAWRIIAQAKVAITKTPYELIAYITDSSKLPQYQVGSEFLWQKDFLTGELPYEDTLIEE